jgi:predicted NBD/HSP70 family sugar kinase
MSRGRSRHPRGGAMNRSRGALYAGIEGGGTKFVCAVARSPVDVVESAVIPTTDPQTTLAKCVRFPTEAQDRHEPIASIGFSCFGPLELRRSSSGFGRMLGTPKPGWSGADLLAPFRARFDAPIQLEVDVGGAALAQMAARRGARPRVARLCHCWNRNRRSAGALGFGRTPYACRDGTCAREPACG